MIIIFPEFSESYAPFREKPTGMLRISLHITIRLFLIAILGSMRSLCATILNVIGAECMCYETLVMSMMQKTV